MKIKHYDPILEKWIIAGVSNADDLELTNPALTDEEGNSISLNQGITKIVNRINKIEDNVAWIYLNGAHGGGGSGGGGLDNIKIEITEGNTIYTSTGVVKFNMLINNGSVSRSFTIIIKDVRTGKVLLTTRKYSLTRIPIEISDITENVELEISAYDSSENYAVPTYLNIIYGAIRLDLQSTPSKTITRGGLTQVPVNFTLTSNVSGAISSFVFKVGNTIIDEQTNITTSPRSLNYDLRDILFNRGLFPNIVAGNKFIFTAQGSTKLGESTINSNIITFDVTVVEADSLVIVTNNISETDSEYEEITNFSQGSQLNFVYYLSYAPTKYNTFNIEYKIYKMLDGEKIDNTPIVSNTIPNVNKSINHVFALSTVDFDISDENEYLMIELKAHSVSDPGDTSAQYTKNVYAIIKEADKVDLYANNDIGTLLAYYSRVSGFPVSTATEWIYPLSETGRFPYTDIFKSQFPNGVKMKLHKTNGSSTGFINNTDFNNTPGIVLNGESYANIEVATQMFPDKEIGEFGFFQSKGFNISMTYKAMEMTDTERVVMNIGRYRNDILDSGIEISLNKIIVKIGTADSMEVKLPVNEIITVDIDVSYSNGWYFKIFINGVLSAVSRVDEEYIDWTFEEDIYLGCRNVKGQLSRYSNITIYDFKIYTSSQTDFAIVQNYISATEQANLLNGSINESLDAELRAKNLFNSEGKCLLWNSGNNSYYEGEALYNILSAEMETNTPYPIVMIREATNSATDFKAFSTAVFSADAKDEIMNKTFPAEIIFKNKLGEAIIQTPNGVAASEGVRVGLQGTSSLSYNAKNYELYMGDMDASGKQLLFQPTEEWLPENRFTLKADVMDSAHVNNVVVGKIINGEITNDSGEKVLPLDPTPPMLLSDNLFSSPEMANEVRSKIKHTSDGFPCLVFIDFAPDRKTGLRETRFLGIYNFNLGRHAQFNLGLKILTDYTKETIGGQPTIITDYSETKTNWNTSVAKGVYSMEINQNHSAQGAFQQDDMEIIKFMADAVYSSQDDDRAYDAVRTFYTQMANMALSQTQKYTMDDAGQTPTKPIPNAYYNYLAAYYNFDQLDEHMYWNNATAYFILAMVFGMVDSMCKNLTLRSWGGDIWYTSFYDMDTSFGLNNAGQDIVEYWAHLHRWYNVQAQDTGITSFSQEKNYTDNNTEGVKQYFASTWNRIWEVLENLPIRDPGSLGDDRDTLETTYANLRLNLFPNPEEFIDKYYKSYTEQTGSIMFNYDYRIKYLKIVQTYNSNTDSYEDTTDFSQLKFLHGNRVIHVKDWFKKRIMFLDGVYGVKGNTSIIESSIDSPANQVWVDNKATGVGQQVLFDIQMSAESKMLYRWSYDKTNGSFWLNPTITNAVVPTPGGETVIYVYANKHITEFGNFKGYPWTSLTSIDLPKLKELDLSGLRNIPANNFLTPRVYNSSTGKGLKSIERLLLNNVQLTNASAYNLNVTGCTQLNHLDISNSNITSVTLDPTAALKYYNLSNTAIRTLTIENQSFLETLLIDNCDDLTEITINNCNALTNLNLPKNVKKLTITNCELLSSISLPYNGPSNIVSELNQIVIDNCPGLKSFAVQGQNNPNLSISLVGAWNLENLDLSYTQTTNMILPSLYVDDLPYFKSLKTLNIANSNITNFVYNDTPKVDGEFVRNDYLDLSLFDNFNSILANNNTVIKEIRFKNNPDDTVKLNTQTFNGCSNLQRVKGHIEITGTDVFKNCRSFKLNDESIYSGVLPNEFLTEEGATNITLNTNSLRSVFEGCTTLSYNDFKRIVAQFNSRLTTVESAFKGASSISGEIWRDMFTNARNVDTLKEFLSGTGIGGTLVSRANNYSDSDETTWGFFDYLPNLNNLESAFEGSRLEWIDNNLFQPKNGVSYKFLVIDNMFRYCSRLKSCEDTRQVVKVAGRLNSKTFFSGLANLLSVYPKFVFSGTQNVSMDIINEGDNTYLFHTRRTSSHNILDNSLYSGVNLYGEIKVNTFGGISNTIGEFRIPKFTSLQYPFSGSGGNIQVNLSEMGSIFRNIGDSLLQAVGIFQGMTTIGNKIIPDDIFQGCSKLNSIESLFANLDIDNNNLEYEFPNETLFRDTIALNNVSKLFLNNKKLKIKLKPKGFINCALKDVSQMFAGSKVFGIIPFNFFYMERDGHLQRTIENMSNIFNSCWLLGYTSDREVDEETLLEVIEYSNGSTYNRYVTWSDGVIKKPGTKVDFKLDVSNLEKTYNYDRDENEYIPNPNYIENEANRPEDYDPLTPETIINVNYNPGEYAFDVWYIDGYGWENALANNPLEQQELEDQKLRMQRYFIYDEYQAQAISDNEFTEWYVKTYQNYSIPSDLFRYCSKDATLEGVLKDIMWNERIIEVDSATNRGVVTKTKNIQGLVGRIPAKIFDSLIDNTQLIGVFSNTHFSPFYGLRGQNVLTLERGLMYPPTLFKNNIELTSVSSMFANTRIPVGVDINEDLFINNSKLRNISSCWSNCIFDSRNYNSDVLGENQNENPQINFSEIFKANIRITNASNLFAVTEITGEQKGLLFIENSLLRTAQQIADISGMFYYNSSMRGNVPTFSSSIYTALNGYGGYLSGVSKGNIYNADILEPRLWPNGWS